MVDPPPDAPAPSDDTRRMDAPDATPAPWAYEPSALDPPPLAVPPPSPAPYSGATQPIPLAPAPALPPGVYGASPAPPYGPAPVYGAPPPYGAPPGYGGYGGAPALVPPTNGTALAALICGILGLVLTCAFLPLGLVLDVVALVLAVQFTNTRKRQPHVPVNPSDDTYARVGQITSIIGLVIGVVLCVVWVLYFGVILAVISQSGQLTPFPTFSP